MYYKVIIKRETKAERFGIHIWKISDRPSQVDGPIRPKLDEARYFVHPVAMPAPGFMKLRQALLTWSPKRLRFLSISKKASNARSPRSCLVVVREISWHWGHSLTHYISHDSLVIMNCE